MTGPRRTEPQGGDAPAGASALPYRPCVGVALADTQGRLFMGQRHGMTDPAWQMPQGGIDAGESVPDAALRELREETGIPASLVRIEAETEGWLHYDLPPEIVPLRWGGRFRGQAQKWVLMRFLGTDADIRLEPDDAAIAAGAHPEFSSWRWMTPEEVLEVIVAFKRPVYAAALAEFAPRL